MRLHYPLEIPDVTDRHYKAVSIGTVNVLFPAYKPVTTSSLQGMLSKLSDSNDYVSAQIFRGENSSLVSVVLQEEYLLLSYLFGDVSDKYIVKYLQRYSGWNKRTLPSIQTSLQYKRCREDFAQPLYRWETDLPHVTVSFSEACEIVALEMGEHQVDTDYAITKIFPKRSNSVGHGHCIIKRRAGWLARPTEFELGFRDNPMLYVVLHEIAHALDVKYYRCNSHGPTFMLIYSSLIEKYMGIDALASMTAAKLFKGERNAD